MDKMPERIFAFPFNPGWKGGYYREEPRSPLDKKEIDCSAEYIRADLIKKE